MLYDSWLLKLDEKRAGLPDSEAKRRLDALMEKQRVAYQELLCILDLLEDHHGCKDICEEGLARYGSNLSEFFSKHQAAATKNLVTRLGFMTKHVGVEGSKIWLTGGTTIHLPYAFMPMKYLSR